MKFVTLLSLTLLCLGCASAKYSLDRRPFSDKVPYMAFQPVTAPGTSLGEIETRVCQGNLFGLIPMDSKPTFELAKEKAISEHGVKYMTDVTTGVQTNNYYFWADKCVYLKGVAYR